MSKHYLTNVSILKDKIFVASSGNCCNFKILGPGGVSIFYLIKPTKEDMIEATTFVKETLAKYHNSEIGIIDQGTKVNMTEKDTEEVFKDYQKFLEDSSTDQEVE